MTDRENVINGLRSIKTYLASQAIETTDSFAREGFIESQKDIDDALALLKEQEAVVRCKDCKHGKPHPCAEYVTCFDEYSCLYGNTRAADWFCADGVKKDE